MHCEALDDIHVYANNLDTRRDRGTSGLILRWGLNMGEDWILSVSIQPTKGGNWRKREGFPCERGGEVETLHLQARNLNMNRSPSLPTDPINSFNFSVSTQQSLPAFQLGIFASLEDIGSPAGKTSPRPPRIERKSTPHQVRRRVPQSTSIANEEVFITYYPG